MKFFLLCFILLLLGFFFLLFYLYVLGKILSDIRNTNSTKAIWILLMFILPILAPILYLLTYKKQ